MANFLNFLQSCSDRFIHFSLENDQVKVHAPKNTLLPEVVAQLREFKPELLAWLRQNENKDLVKNHELSLIGAAQRSTALQLSYGQESIWLAQQFNAMGDAYHFVRILDMVGELNIAALNESFSKIIGRHEALRTVFFEEDGALRQKILPEKHFTIPFTDCSKLDDASRSECLDSLCKQAATSSFDLANDLMMRLHLVRFDVQHHQLIIVLHHIASDGWSLGLLVTEFQECYAKLTQGEIPALAALPVQYADFAQWSRESAQTDALTQSMPFWRDKLEGAPELHSMRSDYARQQQQNFNAGAHRSQLDVQTTTSLNQLAQACGATMFVALETLFVALISRYSQSNDLIIGTPVAGRDVEEVSGLIGYFVNMMVLRHRPDQTLSFNTTLVRAKEEIFAAFEHQHVPIDFIVRDVVKSRSASHHPLFQIVFALQNNAIPTLSLPGLDCSIREISKAKTPFDLQLTATEVASGLDLEWSYSSDLFSASTINRLALHFEQLVRAVLNKPDLAMIEHDILGTKERHQLLVEWNDTTTEYPSEQCIHELFEQQVENHCDSIAVVFEDQHLTYAELNRKANQLAHYLVTEKKLKPDSLVGLCVERSFDMMIGILGILKAGAAYVPLDPDYPSARLAYMLEDAKLDTVITHREIQTKHAITDEQALCLDAPDTIARLCSQPVTNISAASLKLTSSHLAYVIYTSGSTGNPKGALLEHRNVTRLFSASNAWFGFDAQDTWTMFHAYGFDFSVWEMWGALCYGGKLVIVPYLISRAPDLFHALLIEHKVTVLNQTPSAFLQLIAADAMAEQSSKLHLRYVIFGGEALNEVALQAWFAKHGETVPQLINMYGITETTVHVTYQVLQAKQGANAASIGRPIPDLNVYVLDPMLRLAPIGVPGELHVSGAGVARGYLNRPELTAERFIDNPYCQPDSRETNARLYKSGDMARYLSDGSIEYLGRIDSQVKIRGFRIELGEVEAALSALPMIQDVAVLVREDVLGDQRLIAYLVCSPENELGETPLSQVLSKTLSRDLPDYMVPTHYIQLERLPLTANGKLDRNALPKPDLTQLQAQYVAPRTKIEQQLCQIWQEVLGLEQVGSADNFFQLGGHSLLVIKIIASAQRVGLPVTAAQIFSSNTLAELALLIRGNESTALPLFVAPANRIPLDCNRITPEMLPMLDLHQNEIDVILAKIPGGVANVQDIYPLAPMQEGILFHHMMSENSDPSIIPSLFQISGKPQLDLFLQALQFVIDRHDVFRTAILWQGLSIPVQVVLRQATLPVTWHKCDLGQDSLSLMRGLCAADLQWMDLQRAPLLKISIACDAGSQQYFVLLQLHHIIVDHEAMDFILQEMAAYCSGLGEQLPPPTPYRDFVAHARHQAKNNNAETFFRQNLGDVDGTTALFDLRDVQGDGSRIVEFKEDVPAEVGHQLRRLAKAQGVSPASLFHAAWALVLSACSGRETVVFGTVMSGRLQGTAGAGSVFGPMINILPMLLKLDGLSAVELVQQTHRALVDLLPYEQTSLALAQRCSGLPEGTPLFTAMLNYRHSASAGSDSILPNMSVKFLHGQERTNYPVYMAVDDTGDGFALDVQIDQAISPERILNYMQTSLVSLLQALESEGRQNVNAFCILSAQERQQLLVGWNNTKADYPKHACIQELFEFQVARNPDAIALVFEQQQLTYRQLNEKSNQLAHYLLAQKQLKPDGLVGVCLDRSLEIILSILAVLKAGAAYVPLDPAYPAARLAYMLDDAKLDIVITQTELRSRLPIDDAHVWCLDSTDLIAELEKQSTSNIAPSTLGLLPSHLAYVIYTSGSTGNPKGVMIEHASLVNLAIAVKNRYQLTSDDGFLQFATINFDMSVEDIFSALTSGCRLILRSDLWLQSPSYFWQRCADAKVTVLDLPTAYWHELANDQGSGPPACVRHVSIGGEQVNRAMITAWYKKENTAQLRLLNTYGPTECTVDSTFADILDSSSGIGKALPNASMYILNKQLNLCPAGVAGELHIGGVCLARGYLNRPDLTAEKFIDNPFFDNANPDSSKRLYKTGDLVRWLPDGSLDYLGRIDYQVKIRGFRIELGEIESVLSAHHDVSNAIVLAKPSVHGEKRLVAYVVANIADAEDVDQLERKAQLQVVLRGYLHQNLPDYMVPNALVLLDTLPLTPNGKVDRNALPDPEQTQLATLYVAPRTETEKTLCLLWQDVLGIERVGVSDNFFQLGGHSLSATRLLARINQSFSTSLPLRTLFSAKTLENLAQTLSQTERVSTRPALLKRGLDQALVPSFAQQRLWLLDQIDGGSAHYNLASAFRLNGSLNYEAMNHAFATIVKRHESLRTYFAVDDNGQIQQVIATRQFATVPISDLSKLTTGEQQLQLVELMAEETANPFDLSADFMLRTHLLKLSNTEHIILVTMHHIASDGWSMAVLVNEFSALYLAYVQGKNNPLPALEIQYADYAHWQRNWLQGDVLDQQLGYWVKQLANLPTAHSLPLDHHRPSIQSFHGATIETRIEIETRDALATICHEFGATLFMGLHAAFAVLLSRHSNETDIVMGSPIANREQAEVAGLIGFFVNTLVLRADLSGEPSFVNVLEQSKRMLLDAYAHQQVPFEQVLERLQPQRSLRHSPLFQVMLALQNNEEGSLDLPELSLSKLERDAAFSQFDLTLNVRESRDNLLLEWEYNTDLFESGTVTRMAEHFSNLLADLVRRPYENVFQSKMLSEAERHCLLVDWNSAKRPYQKNVCVHELFEEQVAQQPDAVALMFETQQLCYGELNARANQLAHYLIHERQVGPDTLVGICLERSLDMIVAILGILKAGAAYLPLDPDYPAARLAYMISDAQLSTVITHSQLLETTSVSEEIAVCVDDSDVIQAIQRQPSNNISPSKLGLQEQNLAYVIYTSGSTGNPKGVMISHANLVNLVFSVRERYLLGSSDAVLQFSTINFDMSAEDIFGALASGSRLILRSDLWPLTPEDFWQACAKANATVLDLPTAYWHELASDSAANIPQCVRHISIGGEQVNRALITAWYLKERANQITLLNVYGPTECTIDASFAEVIDADCGIGEALPNVRLYVLNPHLELCPVGVAGELHIGGAGLARGYLNRPELTAEKFIKNPFFDQHDSASSSRLYKTGDLVHRRIDGVLDYLGRIDQQVKIRGFRIELGEIENALTSHQQVSDAVVLAKPVTSGGLQLLAYLVVDKLAHPPTSSEGDAMPISAQFSGILRQHLMLSLPDYMVPAVYILLEKFPLMPNGKVDRNALPEPDKAQQQNFYQGPRTEMEKRLCEIWQEVLGIEKIGIDDNFFQLGGHSLLAMRLVAQLNKNFHIDLPLKVLFQCEDVAAMAMAIEKLETLQKLQSLKDDVENNMENEW